MPARVGEDVRYPVHLLAPTGQRPVRGHRSRLAAADKIRGTITCESWGAGPGRDRGAAYEVFGRNLTLLPTRPRSLPRCTTGW